MQGQIHPKINETLSRLGVEKVKSLQGATMSMLIKGNDVMACLPTGYGKSLCFQLLALLDNQLTIVVSPLIATIEDQVKTINKKMDKVVAIGWHSQLSQEQRNSFFEQLNTASLLYCSPESLVYTNLLDKVKQKRNVRRVVIDESHFIHTWGDSFRPAFKAFPSVLASKLPNVQYLSLTATASNETLKTIYSVLGRELQLIQFNPVKDNIHYQTLCVGDCIPSLQQLVRLNGVAGGNKGQFHHSCVDSVMTIVNKIERDRKVVIFCGTRKRVEHISSLLNAIGYSATRYHSGLSIEEKSKNAFDFSKGEAKILVCTNAFGVGVDVPEIDQVFHVDTPLTVDAYLQETGRAGRNGRKADAYLLCSNSSHTTGDALIAISYPKPEVLDDVMTYLKGYAAYEASIEESDPLLFDTLTPLILDHATYVTNLKERDINAALDYFIRTGAIAVDTDSGMPFYQLAQHASFDALAYEEAKSRAKQDFLVMKRYSMLGNQQLRQYLESCYGGGKLQ